MFKSREIYYIEKIESRETKRGEIKKLSTKTKKQTIWVFIKTYK